MIAVKMVLATFFGGGKLPQAPVGTCLQAVRLTSFLAIPGISGCKLQCMVQE